MTVIYRDEAKAIEGRWNKHNAFTSKRHIRIYGESLSDVAKWLKETPRKWNTNSSVGTPKDSEWDLNVGFRGAEKLAAEGWSEGAQDLDQRLQAIMPSSGREAKFGYSVAGYAPNVGRYLAGSPSNMFTKRKKDFGAAPVLHIVVNMNASCMVKASQMKNFGTALVGLIDRLENTGRRIHLDVLYVLKEQEARVAVGWNIKHSQDAVNLANVAFAIAHPAAFRRIGFAMLERLPQECENYGYGYCADIQDCDLIDPVPGAMLIDGVNHEPNRCNSPQDALRLAIEQINKAAVLAGHATPDQPLIEEDETLFA